eukprot:1801832-Prymnesium_polylepis.1
MSSAQTRLLPVPGGSTAKGLPPDSARVIPGPVDRRRVDDLAYVTCAARFHSWRARRACMLWFTAPSKQACTTSPHTTWPMADVVADGRCCRQR